MTEDFRPQTVPTKERAARVTLHLSRKEIAYLVGVLERELGYWTMHQEPGRYAHAFAERLRRVL